MSGIPIAIIFKHAACPLSRLKEDVMAMKALQEVTIIVTSPYKNSAWADNFRLIWETVLVISLTFFTQLVFAEGTAIQLNLEMQRSLHLISCERILTDSQYQQSASLRNYILQHPYALPVLKGNLSKTSKELNIHGIQGHFRVSIENEIYLVFDVDNPQVLNHDVLEALTAPYHDPGFGLQTLIGLPNYLVKGSGREPLIGPNHGDNQQAYAQIEDSLYFRDKSFGPKPYGMSLRATKVTVPLNQVSTSSFYSITLKVPLYYEGQFLNRLKIDFQIPSENMPSMTSPTMWEGLIQLLIKEQLGIEFADLRYVANLRNQRVEMDVLNPYREKIGFASIDTTLVTPSPWYSTFFGGRRRTMYGIEVELTSDYYRMYSNDTEFSSFVQKMLRRLEIVRAKNVHVAHHLKIFEYLGN